MRVFFPFILLASLTSCGTLSKNVYMEFIATDVSYMSKYPERKKSIYLTGIDYSEEADNVIVVVRFLSTLRGTTSLVVDVPNVKVEVHNMMAKLTMNKRAEKSTINGLVHVYAGDRKLQSKPLQLNLYPHEMYRNANSSVKGSVILQKYTNDEIPFINYSDHARYRLHEPSSDECRFAKGEWGSAIERMNGSLQKANALQKMISRKLYLRQGTPSDSMNIAPFEQYIRVLEGRDKLWCTNWVDIFCHAAACFDIPVRRLGLMNSSPYSPTLNLVLAEGHSLVEVYDDRSNQWVVVDLVYGLLGAKFHNMSLNAMDLVKMINMPSYEPKIKLVLYDALKHKVVRLRLPRKKGKDAFYNFYKTNQQIIYFQK